MEGTINSLTCFLPQSDISRVKLKDISNLIEAFLSSQPKVEIKRMTETFSLELNYTVLGLRYKGGPISFETIVLETMKDQTLQLRIQQKSQGYQSCAIL